MTTGQGMAESWEAAAGSAGLLEVLQRKRAELEEVLARYGVPPRTAPALIAEATLAVAAAAGGAPAQGSRLVRAVELVSARWANERRERRDREPSPGAAGDAFGSILRSVAHRLDHRRHLLLAEKEEAREALPELLSADGDLSGLNVEPRFHTWAVVDGLVDAARGEAPNRPARALELCRLAADLVERLDPADYGASALGDLAARVHMAAANAHRIRRDFHSSEAEFGRAERLLDEGSLDPRLRAELLRLRSALCRNQRRLDEAGRLIDQALAIYRWIGDGHEEGRATLSKSLLLELRCDCRGTLELARRALGLLDPQRDGRLQFCAVHAIGFAHAHLGEHDEAARLLPRIQELCDRHGGEIDQLHVDWLAGVLAAAAGDPAGEETLLRVRQCFLDLEMMLDAAIVGMELVTVYLRQGRAADTRRVADEIVAFLTARAAHSQTVGAEALATLVAVQQAARLDRATASLVCEAQDALRRSRQRRHEAGPASADGGGQAS